MSIQALIFYLLIIDSVSFAIFAWFEKKYYTKHFRLLSRLFPPAKGWAIYYIILVGWIGFLTFTGGLF